LSSQERKERAIAVEKKKAAKQTKKLEQDYNAILNQKNSHIKVSLVCFDLTAINNLFVCNSLICFAFRLLFQ
jgi:N12 class adenine-specific DNA methylase